MPEQCSVSNLASQEIKCIRTQLRLRFNQFYTVALQDAKLFFRTGKPTHPPVCWEEKKPFHSQVGWVPCLSAASWWNQAFSPPASDSVPRGSTHKEELLQRKHTAGYDSRAVLKADSKDGNQELHLEAGSSSCEEKVDSLEHFSDRPSWAPRIARNQEQGKGVEWEMKGGGCPRWTSGESKEKEGCKCWQWNERKRKLWSITPAK